MENAEKIEKLRDGSNWPQWQFVMKTLLDCNGALEVCEGTFLKPETPTANAEAAEVTVYTTNLEKWTKADKAAKKLFVTTVEAKPLQFLMNCETSHEMWRKLHTVYDLQSDETLALIQKQFFDFKWSASLSVGEHIAKLEQMTSRMKKLNATIPDSMLQSRILSILPGEYKHFHSAWDSTAVAQRTVENLTTRLLTEEQRLQQSTDKMEDTVALMAKTKLKPAERKGDYSFRGNVKVKEGCFTCGKKDHLRKNCAGCYSCGSKYHLARNCPKKGTGNNQSGGDNKRPTAFIGSAVHTNNKNEWIIDTGATDHMTNDRKVFKVFEEFSKPLNIEIGNGQQVGAFGKGTVEIECLVNGKWLPGNMFDVLYTPDMTCNLFSVKTAAKKDIDFVIKNHGSECVFEKNGKVVATGSEVDNLFKINLRVKMPKIVAAFAANKEDTLQLWHERLAHQNKRHVQSVLRKMNIEVVVNNEFCDGCIYGKMHRRSFGTRPERAKAPREIVNGDLCGPMHVDSIGKKRYLLMFKDDYSGYRSVYFIKNKSEVKSKFELYCNEIKNKFGENIKTLITDNGGEFKNKEMEALTSKLGIKHVMTPPYTPQHNAVIERENRTCVEAARSMLHSKSDLPLSLWAEAINTAAFVLNKTGPTKVPGKSPHELWFNEEYNEIKHFRVFGTECYVHISRCNRGVLDPPPPPPPPLPVCVLVT